MKILFLSFTCEDIGVAMLTNMIGFPLRRVVFYEEISSVSRKKKQKKRTTSAENSYPRAAMKYRLFNKPIVGIFGSFKCDATRKYEKRNFIA